MSSIAAGTTTGSALVSTGDTTGELVLKTNGTTTAVTIDTSQNVTLAGSLTLGSALGVAQGGTGATTLTANNVILGNGTSAVQFVAPGSNGNVLTSNGTTWTSAAASGGGDYVMQVYTSPATWTKPANIKAVKVTVVGGGGGCYANPSPAPTGNGGGTSSFGPFCSATGGFGGMASPTVPSFSGGLGGLGSGGNINSRGWSGKGSNNLSTVNVNNTPSGPTAPENNSVVWGGASLLGASGTPPIRGGIPGSNGSGGSATNDGGLRGSGGGGGAAILYLDAPAIPGPVSVTVGAGGTPGPTPAPLAPNVANGVGGAVIVEEFY